MSAKVYIIRNTINKKFYIGSTSNNVDQRWSTHISSLTQGTHNEAFSEDWKNISLVYWQFEILEDDIPLDQQFLVEQVYINRYKPFHPVGYNVKKKSDIMLYRKKNIFNEKELIDKIVLDLKSGVTYRSIASRYNISLGTVWNVSKKEKVLKPKSPVLNNNLTEKVKELLDKGELSSSEIASMLKIDTDEVYKISKRFHYGNRISRLKEKVLSLKGKSLSYREISDRLKISLGSIHTIIKQNGIDTFI